MRAKAPKLRDIVRNSAGRNQIKRPFEAIKGTAIKVAERPSRIFILAMWEKQFKIHKKPPMNPQLYNYENSPNRNWR